MTQLRGKCGPGSSVGIATGYGLDSTGIESRWGEIFRTCPERLWGPPSLLYNGYCLFPGGKKRPGRDADPSSTSSAVVMKGWSYTSNHPMGRTTCTEPQCLYTGCTLPLPYLLVRLFLWKAILSQLVQNFQAICKIQIFVIVFTRIRLCHPITDISTPIPPQPPAGQVLFIIKASKSHSGTHHIR